MKSSKMDNPFRLPRDGHLFAFWHYLNTSGIDLEPKKLSRKQLCDNTFERDLKARHALKNELNQTRIFKELNPSGSTFSKLRYVQDIRLLCKLRLLIGEKRDGYMLLDQKLALNRKQYLASKSEYNDCVNALELFLANDYNKSMQALKMASYEEERMVELTVRRDELAHLCGKAWLDVYQWEDAWRTVRTCHRFLHKVSPRVLMETPENQPVKSRSSKVDRHRMNESDIGKTTTPESVVEDFEAQLREISNSKYTSPKDLGLSNAEDILQVFKDIESQNLNVLIHLNSLNAPMNDMISRIKIGEVCVKYEIENVLDDIENLEKEIHREEARANDMRERTDEIIGESLRELVASKPALTIRVLVEDAYESCIARNESGLEPVAMAIALEAAYEELSCELDILPRHLVVECERDGFRNELRETREAEEASEKFELMHRLLNAVKRLMEPLEPKRRPLMKRSTPMESNDSKDEVVTLQNENESINFFEDNCN